MSAGSTTSGQHHLGATMRRDAWWLELLPVIILLSAFGAYATLRAFEGKFYEWGPCLSPFYSPEIFGNSTHAMLSPALLILAFPLGFRVTCYYYRKAYYRAFFLDPPACAVAEPSKRRYRGESAFPFILQNLHRYFLYIGFIFLAFLWRDAVRAFVFDGHFGVGVGTVIMLLDVTLLTIYALSCHSLRHLIGGKLDCFSCARFGGSRHTAWSWLTVLNERHMLYAWVSLITVGLTDLYIRLVACGSITDMRLF